MVFFLEPSPFANKVCLMKSAYELAMERLEKEEPSKPLTDQQREQIAEIQNQSDAKIAEKRVFLQDQIKQARQSGDAEKAQEIEQEMHRELKRLEEQCEQEKQAVRDQG
jgi:hypothetical protein